MLFKPDHVAPILSGQKTQTRRTWKKCRAKPGSVHKAKLSLFSKDSFARLEILDVYQEFLGDISEEDARAEGYESRDVYFEAFFRIYRVRRATVPLYMW